ncbi:MAG: hypothetical protein KDE55_01280 [Novosphingobium sp.]|nr:hypothetical protein [Novosphingobium sp.]
MIGKIIGAIAGSQVAKTTRGIEGPAGAAVGVIAAAALRRMSWPAIVALSAGGYLAKKFIDGRKAEAELEKARADMPYAASNPDRLAS